MKFLRTLLPIFTCAAAVSGCIFDHDKSQSDANTSYIPIKGLHYESASYSGYTNTEGEYRANKGETTTFSIGQTRIASFESVSSLTLDDFLATNLPDNEHAVAAALSSDSDGSFHRMANIAALLMVLDYDQNPSNGIDLSNWQGSNSLPPVDLNQNLYRFFYLTLAELAQSKGLTRRNLAVSEPLSFIYRLAGIQVEVEMPDKLNNQPIFEYDSQGRITKYRVYGDSAFSTELSYRSDGRISEFHFPEISIVGMDYSVIYNSDFRPIQRYEKYESKLFKYDSSGFLTAITEAFFGTISQGEFSYSYNSDDGIQRTTEKCDTNFDGVTDKTTQISQYLNNSGDFSRRDVSINNDASGSEYIRISERYHYDIGGNISGYVYEKNNAMTVEMLKHIKKDFIRTDTGKLQSYSEQVKYNDGGWHKQSLTFNESGKILRKIYSDGTDDVLGGESVYDYQYDNAGNQTQYKKNTDSQGDGVVDVISVIDSQYSDSGQFLASKEIMKTRGIFDYYQVKKNIYNDQGKLTIAKTETDSDGNGITDSIVTTTSIYNDSGDLILGQSVLHQDGNGVTESITESSFTYTASGHIASKHLLQDKDGDGTVDFRDDIFYGYKHRADGLSYLVENNIPINDLTEWHKYALASDFWLQHLHAMGHAELMESIFNKRQWTVRPDN